jgi:Enoyl-(Acyl carrier protein) reductase
VEIRLAISSAAHRGADPVEIARAVVWLASDDASFVLGQTLAIDGKMSAGGSALPESSLSIAKADDQELKEKGYSCDSLST